jgi:hypothetical protein
LISVISSRPHFRRYRGSRARAAKFPETLNGITQGGGAAILTAARDDKLPASCIRVPAAHSLTMDLGGM